jgi:hypothetical protein
MRCDLASEGASHLANFDTRTLSSWEVLFRKHAAGSSSLKASGLDLKRVVAQGKVGGVNREGKTRSTDRSVRTETEIDSPSWTLCVFG